MFGDTSKIRLWTMTSSLRLLERVIALPRLLLPPSNQHPLDRCLICPSMPCVSRWNFCHVSTGMQHAIAHQGHLLNCVSRALFRTGQGETHSRPSTEERLSMQCKSFPEDMRSVIACFSSVCLKLTSSALSIHTTVAVGRPLLFPSLSKTLGPFRLPDMTHPVFEMNLHCKNFVGSTIMLQRNSITTR